MVQLRSVERLVSRVESFQLAPKKLLVYTLESVAIEKYP